MKRSVWHKIDQFARQLTPFAITLMLVIVSVIPSQIPGLFKILPVLPMISVYHWSIHRPALLPAYAVFLVGLFYDGLTGTPFGLHALIFLGVQGIVLFQHRFFVSKSFFIVWLGFGLVAAIAALMGWTIMSLYHLTPLAMEPLLFQYVLTLSLFPLLSWAFMRWQQTFLSEF